MLYKCFYNCLYVFHKENVIKYYKKYYINNNYNLNVQHNYSKRWYGRFQRSNEQRVYTQKLHTCTHLTVAIFAIFVSTFYGDEWSFVHALRSRSAENSVSGTAVIFPAARSLRK